MPGAWCLSPPLDFPPDPSDKCIDPMSEKRQKKSSADFRRACRFLYPYRGMVAASIAAAVGSGVFFTVGLSALFPILKVLLNGQTVQQWVHERMATYAARPVPEYLKIADQLSGHLPANPVATVAVLFSFITVLAVAGNVIRFFQEYLSDKAAIKAVNDARLRLYDRVLHLPMNFFGTRGTSDVTSRLVGDALGLQEGFKLLLGRAVQEPVNATLALGLALFIDWRLTVFIIIFTPLMFAVLKKFGKKVRRASRAAMQNNATMLGQIEGSLTGVRVVKSAGAERFERRRYRGIVAELEVQQLKMARYEAISTPVVEMLGMLAAGSVLIVASYLVLVQKSLDQAGFFVVIACLVSIGESMRRLSKLNNTLQRANAAAARIFETLDEPAEQARGKDEGGRMKDEAESSSSSSSFILPPSSLRASLPPLRREIAFEDVSFSYPNTSTPAVEGVTLRVAKGQSVAIVGRNGSGKTTLLALLPRFYDPSAGRVLIDGIDVASASLRSLRRQIGIVTQDPVVFPGTIAQNIAYARPAATRDEIVSAAKRAYAHEFIIEKPQGYDTLLDGLGGQLSGGQKQRLNIARAVLRDTPILILDEATSQVDAESEHLIQRAVEQLMHERTTFVIAHRFSTILNADQIVVMDRGRIVGSGSHEELMRTSTVYKQLYERQLSAA